MTRNQRAAGRLLFERLECRRVLAGNVTAALVDGTLTLTGDIFGNGIAIVGTETPGEVRVTGTPAMPSDQTLVNGQSEPLTFVVTNDIVIDTGGGNDGVEVAKVILRGSLKIEAGDDLDYVCIGSSRGDDGAIYSAAVSWPPAGQEVPGAKSSIHPDSHLLCREQFTHRSPTPQASFISAASCTWGRATAPTMSTSAERRLAPISPLEPAAATTYLWSCAVGARNLNLGMARGADLVNISVLATRGAMTLETGFDNDIVSVVNSHARGSTSLLGSDGHNHFAVTNCLFDGSLYGAFGDQSDRVTIRNSVMKGSATFFTRGGFDRIDVDYSVGMFFSANTGAGSDLVCVRGSALDNIFANLGEGDDQMWMVGSAVERPILSDGGAGIDYIHHRSCRMTMPGLANFEGIIEGWPAGLDA